jgi:hypothetical protein
MPIDRTRFLLLTAALSAAACGKAHKSSDDAAATDNNPTGPSAADEANAELKDGGGSGGHAGGGHGGGTGGGRAGDGGVSGGGSGGTGGACTDNSVGLPGDCSTLKAPGPSCESFSTTQSSCTTFKKALRPRVAQSAVACLLKASNTKAVCDFNKASSCFKDAVAQGCIDPATVATCDPIVKNCGSKLSAGTCERLLSAVTSKHTQAMVGCMNEGCDVAFCLDSLQ